VRSNSSGALDSPPDGRGARLRKELVMEIKLNPEIAAAFTEEAKSYLSQAAGCVRSWGAGDAQALAEPRRLVHTIKGAAAMVGLPALAHVCLALEQALKSFAAAHPLPGDPRPGQLAQVIQAIGDYVDGILEGAHRGSALESAIVVLRRAKGESVEGDSAVLREIFGVSEPVHEVPPANAGPVPAAALSDDMLANFRQEGEDLLLLIGRSLRVFQAQPDSLETLRALRRGVHSLKGTSQTAGQRGVVELSHQLEDLFDGLLNGSVAFSPETSRLIFAAFDVISDLVTGDLEEASAVSIIPRFRDDFAAIMAGQSTPGGALPKVEEPDQIPQEFLEVFRPEADEHLAVIATGLRELAADHTNRTALQDVRRAVHTLKGAAGVIGLMQANTLAHRMEDLLDGAWDGSAVLNPELLQLLFRTSDVLTDLIGDPAKQADAMVRRAGLLRSYEALARSAPSGAAAKLARQPEPESAPASGAGDSIDLTSLRKDGEAPALRGDALSQSSRYVRVPIDRLDEMVRLVSELVVSRSTFEQHLDSYHHDVGELRLSLLRLQRLSHKFDTDFEAQALLGGMGWRRQPSPGPVPIDSRAEFDSLEFDRYTDLHLASRDLAETSTDISVGVAQLSHVAGDFESYVNRMGRLTSDIQDRLMRMRMVPLANLASRLHRTVRVTSERVGKLVDLTLEGEDIEMDKTSLEELAGPLEHLIRNGIDHGIETPAAREAAGKPVRGRVTVKAYYAGTQVVVEVTDDGRGVDSEAVLRKAIGAGIVSERDASVLDEGQVFEFLFEPGFSTAAQVTEISGRGVGLDVVKSAVEKLKGTVRLTSQRGSGASFQLRLPMSLAILRVLMVKSRGEVYAVPLANVTRILRLETKQLERTGNRQILRLGEQVMPAARLEEVLGGKARGEDEASDLNPRQPVLVVDMGGQQAAILVDELLVAREVVVKSLGSMVRHVRGVTGATILGDGSIVLIVNTSELFETERSTAGGSATPQSIRRARQKRHMGYDVLVVDDSVSVRRVLSNLFQNQGWRPISARDGLEALEILQSGQHADVVLLDMEMPRMDGYELLTLLRGQQQFATLPVIMLTSRAAEKHKKKAFELGATEFLVKPYQDEALIATVNRVVAGREALAG